MKSLVVPSGFNGALFREAYGYTPESARRGFITNCPDESEQSDIDAMVFEEGALALAQMRAAREREYRKRVPYGDQADATFKQLAWAQMRAGTVKSQIDASSLPQGTKDVLNAILSCFNAISEVDDIISIRNQIKSEIRLEDFQ